MALIIWSATGSHWISISMNSVPLICHVQFYILGKVINIKLFYGINSGGGDMDLLVFRYCTTNPFSNWMDKWLWETHSKTVTSMIPQVDVKCTWISRLRFTSRYYYLPRHRRGRGNRIGPVCVCMYVCVGVCVCLQFSGLPAEPFDVRTRILVWGCTFIISRPKFDGQGHRSKVKVTRSKNMISDSLTWVFGVQSPSLVKEVWHEFRTHTCASLAHARNLCTCAWNHEMWSYEYIISCQGNRIRSIGLCVSIHRGNRTLGLG